MNDNQLNTIYANIKYLANEKGITLAKLANSIDMTETGFHSAMRNDSLKLIALLKLAEKLQVDITSFFEQKEGNNSIARNNNLVANSEKVNIANQGGVKVGECVGVDLYERLLLEKDRQLVAKDNEIEFLRSMVKK